MKTLAELAAIKAKMQEKVAMREGAASTRIVAGARPVLNAFVEEINKEGLFDKVTVTQTGCIGICQFEPVVEVYTPDNEKVTYVKMTAEKVKRVVSEHIKGGNIVSEYTIGNAK